MTFFESAILGIVQGLTEFIPVSSTGHLIIVREMLGLSVEGTLAFDAILQLATLFAVLLYFWRDIFKLIKSAVSFLFRRSIEPSQKVLLGALVIGTVPALIFGLLLESHLENVRSSTVVALSLLVGSLVFYLAEKFGKQNTELSIGRGLLVGFFQVLALVPGFSRSGATISGGLFVGLNREDAARFSFLLSIPIILGSGLKKVFNIYQTPDFSSIESSLFIASTFAFVSGILAIHFLLKFLKNHSLNYFGVYRVLLAAVILLFF